MKVLREVIPYLMFPLLMGTGIGLTLLCQAWGLAPMTAFSAASLMLFLVIFTLEKLLPHRRDWLVSDGQEFQDLGHTFLGTALGAGLGEQLTQLAFVAAGLWLAQLTQHSLWPHAWPFWLQLIGVYLLADLGRYLQHRLLHQSAFLWRFHALHHSVERICTLKTSRSHIVERLFQPLFMFGPLLLLGASPEVLFWFIVPNSFLGMMDHSNVDIRLGPLSYIVNGPAEHRLHHSRDMREGNSNFGSALVLWDMLFGTYINPRPYHSPKAVGIAGDTQPAGFWQQVWAPFLPAAAPQGLEPTEQQPELA